MFMFGRRKGIKKMVLKPRKIWEPGDPHAGSDLPLLLTPKRCPRVREKPTARATEPRRPFRRSSYVAKMHSTNWSVKKISTVVAWPTLTPGCN